MSSTDTNGAMEQAAEMAAKAAGIPSGVPSPADAMAMAAGLGGAVQAILGELAANRERTDTLIEATHRQTVAVESLLAAVERIEVKVESATEKLNAGGLLKLLKG